MAAGGPALGHSAMAWSLSNQWSRKGLGRATSFQNLLAENNRLLDPVLFEISGLNPVVASRGNGANVPQFIPWSISNSSKFEENVLAVVWDSWQALFLHILYISPLSRSCYTFSCMQFCQVCQPVRFCYTMCGLYALSGQWRTVV